METPHWPAASALQAAARGLPPQAWPAAAGALHALLADALTLLPPEGAAPLLEPLPHLPQPLPGFEDPLRVLQECLALCQTDPAARPPAPEPIRTLHHLACSGGTLVSKCLAAVPNVQLLSEIDPLSPHQLSAKPRFAPTDMVTQLRQSTRGTDTDTLIALFQAELRLVHQRSSAQGQRLLLRDHAHSHFCRDAAVPQRPGLAELVRGVAPVCAALTVRHPLDSWASLQANRWLHFQPATFDEYCRRTHAFLDHHAGTPVQRYEDFVADPVAALRQLCDWLALPYADHAPQLFGLFQLTGDSGRSDTVIAPRPPRPVAPGLADEAAASDAYLALVARLGYAHRIEGAPATDSLSAAPDTARTATPA